MLLTEGSSPAWRKLNYKFSDPSHTPWSQLSILNMTDCAHVLPNQVFPKQATCLWAIITNAKLHLQGLMKTSGALSTLGPKHICFHYNIWRPLVTLSHWCGTSSSMAHHYVPKVTKANWRHPVRARKLQTRSQTNSRERD